MKTSWRKAILCAAALSPYASLHADALDAIRSRGFVVWGGDQEGGGPYVYPDPAEPSRLTGFEVELADLLAGELSVKASFFQGPWDNLPALLNTGSIDVILNGYELTAAHTKQMDHSRPYYVYELVLLRRRGNGLLAGWDDLRRRPGGNRAKVGVLVMSSSHRYLEEHFTGEVDIVTYDGNTDALRDVELGKLDATLLDLPIATFYRDRFKGLEQVGDPVGRGYYVIYLRKGEERLRESLDAAISKLIRSGQLKALYERYGIWTGSQEELEGLAGKDDFALGVRGTAASGLAAVAGRLALLLKAAGMTVFLACASMPLAIVLGLFVALGRLYGPAPLRWVLLGYVEFLRGTPLMLQLFVIFFLLPEAGIQVPALVAAILGLGINYSAYEAEIYRAGLQAIPPGQMEAALALGMPRGLSLRRIIVPQATRIVIPPVTNDFIALFKDTSVCSVITVTELTKEYSILRTNTGATIELALLTALLYLLMSIPLSHLASRLESKLGRSKKAG